MYYNFVNIFFYKFINWYTSFRAFFRGYILHVFIVLLINLAGIVSIFYIKNTRIVGIALIIYGTLVLTTATFFGIPGFILFVIAGIIALKEKQVVKESK